ncbi:MAG: CDP-alcohol phosphatidyltransferase family protein [Luteolibacter sp.]
MTFATKITIGRICLVPVFAIFAILYGIGAGAGEPVEAYRWAAFGIFVVAATSDGIDGWIARHFDQKSELGAMLDPIADKALVLTAVVILTCFQWGPDGWRIPKAFAALVILRDVLILVGIRVMWSAKRKVEIRPHWTGKICTFGLFLVIAWVMLRFTTLSPIYPSAFAAVFVIWSMVEYIRHGLRIMRV